MVFASAVALFACPTAYAKDSTASVKEAEQYVAKGNLKAAEIELRNAIREAPQDPVLHARLAEVYLQLGDSAAAEREARAALERKGEEADYISVLMDALLRQEKFADLLDLVKPGDRTPALESKVRTGLGTAEAGLRDREKAEDLLREAVNLDPTAARPKIQLARLLTGTKPEEAGKFIDEAIAANPRSAEALQVKGEMLRSRGDQDGAVRLFDEALKIDPKNLLAHLSRANVNITLGKYKAADEDLDPILKAAPNNFMANYLRGLELAKKQDYAAADRIFDRISPAFSVFWAGYYLQGATKLALGQFAQAEGILAKYLSRVPDDLKAARLIAGAALQQRSPSRAIEYLKPIVDKVPADAATLTLLGNAYMAEGKPDLALQQFEKAAALDPDNPAIKTRVGISEIDIGQGQQGLSTLEQVFATEAGAPVAGPTLVLSELRAKRLDKAAEVANSLVKRDAKNPLYFTLLGIVRVSQHDFSAAENSFRAALEINPEFPAATRDLAQLYVATGRIDDAKKAYTDLLAKKADDVTALLGLSDIYISEKKWPEATDAINRARSAAKNDPSPGLKLVGLYESRQDWKSAKSVAAELASQFPGDVNVLEAQGRAQRGAGDMDGAVSSYKRAHELAPNSIPILSRYLSLLNENKYFVEARGVLQDAIARDPRNVSLKADLIRIEGQINGVDAAVGKAQALAKDDPDSNVYDLVATELYEKAGRTPDAIAMLDKAVAARPSDDGLINNLAQLYQRAGNPGKAEGVLVSRLKADPKDATIKAALASLYLTTGQIADARKIFIELSSQRPNDAVPLLGLAEAAAKEKNWSEATDYINRARAAAPNDPTPEIALVNLYGSQQDWKNAAAAANAVAERFPANPEALDAKGRAQIATGDKEGASATYKRIYELAPNSLPVLSRYLALLNSTKDFSQARTVLQTALARDPKNSQLKGDLIRVEAEIDGLEAGLAKARSLAQADPGNPVYDMVSAELWEKAGRSADAVTLLEKAVAARPSEDNLVAALARLYTRTGEPGKAEAVLNSRLKIEPKDLAIRSTLASIYLEQKKYDNAIEEYTRITADHPADAAVLNNLAWLYQQKGDLVKARGLAERATAASPRVPQIDDTLGWILLAQGDAQKALTYLSAASLSAPGNPDIQYHLAVALHRVGRQADAQATLENLLGSGASFSDKAEAEKLLQELKRS
ncbi:MAG TPA: XrtA/PEP-CTERM system TPR-repeat protein PrsT [Stellaceae bacterium]|nr:XrtA/PEP-CTERM system TPR-repeat protein PrsT [Stellaceae bacterium]